MNVDAEVRRKSIYEHPKFLELRNLGIKNEDQIERAVITYIKLIEVQLWYHVQMVVIPEQELVFVKGRKSDKDANFEFVLPVGIEENHSVESFEEKIDIAQKHGCHSESILIATYDETSSLLFYRISKGLIPPKEMANRQVGRNRVPEWNEQQGKWKYL